LPPHDFDRVDAAIEAMRVDPFAGDVLKLTHAAAGYRKRVGSYRVLFDAFHERRHVDVVAVLRRTSTTYKRRR
jgi:mRNA-degrading endonuclease RelE of RelBE toxin-antitoxin system